MLRRIRLLVFDLDYLIFDCARLKVKALRESLMPFADSLPQSVRLPDEVDAEEGYCDHGVRWPQFLEIGLGQEQLIQFQSAYRINEERLAAAGEGRVFPGLEALLAFCRQNEALAALGAEAGRDYLLAVSDRYGLDSIFDMAYCTEEFGMGSADEMFEEIMLRAEVNPSETLVLATRPEFFQAARRLDVISIGCGWGLQRHEALSEADLPCHALADAVSTIEKADAMQDQAFA